MDDEQHAVSAAMPSPVNSNAAELVNAKLHPVMTTVPAEVRDALLREFPSLDLASAELIGEGWNATVWRVLQDQVWWVIRVPKLDWAAGELERQTRLGLHLAELGFPVPREWRTLRDQNGTIIAGSYMYIHGQCAPAHGRRALVVLAGKLATFLTHLHSLPTEFAIHRCEALALDPWPDRYQTLIATYQPLTGPRTRSWLAQISVRLEQASQSTPQKVLVHGDLAPEHVLCDTLGHIIGVLDFSGPLVTDPAIDFGRLVQHWGVPFARSVLSSYGGSVDRGFDQRMVMYAKLEALRTIEAGVTRQLPAWVAWGRRRLAAAAAADGRAST